MINPYKSHLKRRKLKYDKIYKNKRLNIYKNKYATNQCFRNTKEGLFDSAYFDNPIKYLEYLEDMIIDTTGRQRLRYKRKYWFYTKLPGKLIKSKSLLTTKIEKYNTSEKIRCLLKFYKKCTKQELKEYFNSSNFSY